MSILSESLINYYDNYSNIVFGNLKGLKGMLMKSETWVYSLKVVMKKEIASYLQLI